MSEIKKRQPIPRGVHNAVVDGLQARIAELESALKETTRSYEYYCCINDPKSEGAMDEYDTMMYPIWEKVRDLLEVS